MLAAFKLKYYEYVPSGFVVSLLWRLVKMRNNDLTLNRNRSNTLFIYFQPDVVYGNRNWTILFSSNTLLVNIVYSYIASTV